MMNFISSHHQTGRSQWLLIFGFLCLIISQIPNLAQANEEKDSLKKAFKNYPVADRNAAIAEAQIFKKSPLDKAIEENQTFSLTDWLTEKCGGEFKYSQSGNSITWPQVTCEYSPDDGSFGGYTSKFNCLFDSPEKRKKEARKVKYAEPKRKLSKVEISPVLIAATTANLLGFYSNIYCPAVVTCKNCPSNNPWANDRSKATPGKESFQFPLAMIEKQPKVYNIKNVEDNSPQSQGLYFDELAMLSEKPELRRQQMIEREAFLLWQNFIVDLDAFHFNQRIACREGHMEGRKAICTESIAYTHDYGHAFYEYLSLSKWQDVPMLVSKSDGLCYGGVTSKTFEEGRDIGTNKDKWLGASFSDEARILFLSKIKKITPQLWAQIFELSRAKETSGFLHKVNFDLFIEGVNSKIRQLETARCASIDSRKTLLSQ